MLGELLRFLRKTNALALAGAVIIGGAIGKVVTSGALVDFVIIAFFVRRHPLPGAP